ncbi:MAG: hypothetical protein ACLFP8_01060 [Alphaproteobacteria bacterium]
MSIPPSISGTSDPAPSASTEVLSGSHSTSAAKQHAKTQDQLLLHQANNPLRLFALIFGFIQEMLNGGDFASSDFIKEFSQALGLNTDFLSETVGKGISGGIPPYKATRNVYDAIEPSKVDMDKVEQAIEKYTTTGSPLLELIADKESGGDYNRIYGKGHQTRPLTTMTIDEVLQWQKDYVNSGSPSSAAGKYQIIRKTLAGLKDEMRLNGNELFDEDMQDRMAIQLLNRRGYDDYLTGKLSEEKFMLNVSKEWASMPKDESGRSYYADDGLNEAHASPATLLLAMRHTKEQFLAEQQNPQDTGLTATFRKTQEKGGVAEQSPGQPEPATAAFNETVEIGGVDQSALLAAVESAAQALPQAPTPSATIPG